MLGKNDLVVIDRSLLIFHLCFHNMGWKSMADASQLVHANMQFDPNSSPQCFRSADETIQKDTRVRIQIVGTRVEANDIVR